MEGYGLYTWKDNRQYQGQYKNEKKHGFGIYKWADGRRYEGYWSNGKQHGLGKYIIPKEGIKKHGLWEDGKRIKWFDDETIQDINKGDTTWWNYFNNPDSSNFVEKDADFCIPREFDMRIIEVNDKLSRLDK